jgi:hypothetical protein
MQCSDYLVIRDPAYDLQSSCGVDDRLLPELHSVWGKLRLWLPYFAIKYALNLADYVKIEGLESHRCLLATLGDDVVVASNRLNYADFVAVAHSVMTNSSGPRSRSGQVTEPHRIGKNGSGVPLSLRHATSEDRRPAKICWSTTSGAASFPFFHHFSRRKKEENVNYSSHRCHPVIHPIFPPRTGLGASHTVSK